MKPRDGHPAISPAAVAAALDAAGAGVSQDQARSLAWHASEVLRANESLNLTRITEPDRFITLHIVDSLLPWPLVGRPLGSIIDIGSGAGFPGIPLAVLGHRVTLCEATKKKADLLAEWIEVLGLDASVLSLRAEEVATTHHGSFDTVVARAVSSLASLLELASPLLGAGGRLVALKGAPSIEEVDHARRVGRIVGMSVIAMPEYSIPASGERRTLCIYEKTGAAEVSLPRRPGLAQRQPLEG